MNEALIAIVLLLVLWMVLRPKIWRAPKSKPAEAWEVSAYRARPGLFVGRAEATLFEILKADLPAGYHVFSKVRLEDILAPKPKYKGQVFWRLRGRIKSRHLDFLICKDNGQFVCGIELDGRSHQSEHAQMIDRFKDQIFDSVGIPLVRIKVGDDFRRVSRQLIGNFTID